METQNIMEVLKIGSRKEITKMLSLAIKMHINPHNDSRIYWAREVLNSVIGWDDYRKRCCFVQYLGGRFVLGNDDDSVKITAWQPIPEPYRPEKGTE